VSGVIEIQERNEAARARPRRLAIETTGREDVVVRALTLLRRRGCRILAVDFHLADRHGPGRFEVAIVEPPRTGSQIESWLMGLVDVTGVVERR
jgi:acetolactate synthase regulatory subunit